MMRNHPRLNESTARNAVLACTLVLLACCPLTAQAASIAPLPPGDISALLADIKQTSHNTMSDLARVRIDRWKMDGDSKQEAMSNAESVRRNLSAALPALVEDTRNAPNSLTVNFKLYRTLSALYDVLSPLAAAGVSSGPRDDGESLVRDAQDFDRVRRAFGERFAQLAAYNDAELTHMRQAAAAAAAAPPPPPKKIVVDDNEPAPKKKPAKKSTPSKPSSSQ